MTKITNFDSLIITRLGGAIREYKSVYDWSEELEKKDQIYTIPHRVPLFKQANSRIVDLFSEVITSLKDLIKGLKTHKELDKATTIYSNILSDLQKAQKETKTWMDDELNCFVDFAQNMKETGKIDKNMISKFKSNKVKELYDSVHDNYNKQYSNDIIGYKGILEKAWGHDGYLLAKGEKTEYGIKFIKFRRKCFDVIIMSDKYTEWIEKSKEKKLSINEVKKLVADFFDKLQKGVYDIISYAEREILPGINLNSTDFPDLGKLKQMKTEIVSWALGVLDHINKHPSELPDKKQYKVEDVDFLENLIRDLEKAMENKRIALGIK